MVFSKYLLGGNYMILVCQDEISISPARLDFTVRLHKEVKLHLGKMGQFPTWYLFRFVYILLYEILQRHLLTVFLAD